ncbi:NlpC/P60 family protein (plasmid) [Kribbella sp. CWNU-51]
MCPAGREHLGPATRRIHLRGRTVATNGCDRQRTCRRPPVGALVFWETSGPYGHVAVYVGNGRIVSNDIGDRVPGEGGVYLVPFELIESRWNATYLGWAPPIYSTT